MFQYVKVQTKAQNYLGRFVCCNDVLDVLCASFKIFVVGFQYQMDEGIDLNDGKIFTAMEWLMVFVKVPL